MENIDGSLEGLLLEVFLIKIWSWTETSSIKSIHWVIIVTNCCKASRMSNLTQKSIFRTPGSDKITNFLFYLSLKLMTSSYYYVYRPCPHLQILYMNLNLYTYNFETFAFIFGWKKGGWREFRNAKIDWRWTS